MKFQGHVTAGPFAVGSKSEHNAVRLVTDTGSYVLRRQGGNAFSDAVLDALVGAQIECEGMLRGNTLIMSEWRKV